MSVNVPLIITSESFEVGLTDLYLQAINLQLILKQFHVSDVLSSGTSLVPKRNRKTMTSNFVTPPPLPLPSDDLLHASINKPLL